MCDLIVDGPFFLLTKLVKSLFKTKKNFQVGTYLQKTTQGAIATDGNCITKIIPHHCCSNHGSNYDRGILRLPTAGVIKWRTAQNDANPSAAFGRDVHDVLLFIIY